MIRKHLRRIVFISFFISFSLNAETLWKGTTSESWNVAGNWSNGVPVSGGDAIINEKVSGVSVSRFPVINSSTTSISALLLSRDYAGTSQLTLKTGASLMVTGFTRLGHAIGSLGILTVNGGTLDTYTLHVGFNSQVENAAGSGRLYLNGGLVRCSDLGFGEDFSDYSWGGAGGVIDISGGCLCISGNVTANISRKINAGQIIAYGGKGTVVYDYGQTCSGYTTVEALPPANTLNSDTWVATDALGRQLPDYAEVGPVRSNKFVGIFYWLWHYQSNPGPYDISKLIAANPTVPHWGAVYDTHYWGEPELGYYDSADTYVLGKHASMLSDAGVDVIVFDTTNSPYTWQDKYMALCSEFRRLRNLGTPTPQIAFMAPFGDPTAIVESLYNNLYAPGLYKELWFRWDNKPLILANRSYFSSSSAIYNFFTFRRPMPSYFTGPTASNQWSWLEVYPQHAFYDAGGSREQVTVGVAQNAVAGKLAFMSHKDGAMGRSWHNGAKDTGMDAVNYGYNFAEQWQRALTLDPEFVFITGWNEWTSMRFQEWSGYTGSDSYYSNALFIDQYNQEYSRDIEPMKGGHTDNYYYQMIDNIRRFKGVQVSPTADEAKTIVIDGTFSDWDSITLQYKDTPGDTIHRDIAGVGTSYYTNGTGRNDIIESKVAFDAYDVYFYVKTAENLSPCTDSNWMLLFINADRDSATGWEGYDYVLNRCRTESAASLEYFTSSTDVEFVGYVPYSYSGGQLEVAIPRVLIRQDNQKVIAFDFKWADNIRQENNSVEFSTSGDSAPNRRFNYRYNKTTPATYFEQNGDFEGWAMARLLTNGAVAGGMLSADISGTDSYMTNSKPFDAAAAIYRYIHIRMKNQSSGTIGQIYWTTTSDGTLNENKHTNFVITPHSDFIDYWIDLGNHAYWKGTISQLRLDPSEASSGHIDIDFIRLQNRMPECGDFGYASSDFNMDCTTDALDMVRMAQQWLASGTCLTTDLNHDAAVNLLDMSILAQNWLVQQ